MNIWRLGIHECTERADADVLWDAIERAGSRAKMPWQTQALLQRSPVRDEVELRLSTVFSGQKTSILVYMHPESINCAAVAKELIGLTAELTRCVRGIIKDAEDWRAEIERIKADEQGKEQHD